MLENGYYDESSNILINIPLTIRATEAAKPLLNLKGRIEVKADLHVCGISIETSNSAEAFRLQPSESIYSFYLQGCQVKAKNQLY